MSNVYVEYVEQTRTESWSRWRWATVAIACAMIGTTVFLVSGVVDPATGNVLAVALFVLGVVAIGITYSALTLPRRANIM